MTENKSEMAEMTSILIVDDNISLCQTMSLILGRKGYAVSTAQDGMEAIERVEERPFDMIFMDIKMPLMNGLETYKRLKKIRPKAAVAMMTAYAVEDLVQEAVREGVCGVFYKPLDIEKVVSLVESREAKQGALILVLDDDPANCITLESILTKKNHKVDIAHLGEEAIAMAQETPYDILFLDMKLPTINGLETYLRIKELNSKVVTIIMTAHRQEMGDLIEEALNDSVYCCLYKPLNMPEVLRLIEEIMKRKQRLA